MNVSNDYYVKQGRTISHKGKHFSAGKRFPAADLDIDKASFAALVHDKSIVTGKERNAFMRPEPSSADEEPKDDGLEDKNKAELQQIAEDLGLEVPGRAGKDELIKAIREATE